MPEIGDADITIHADGSPFRRELDAATSGGGSGVDGLRARFAGLGSELSSTEKGVKVLGGALTGLAAAPGLAILAGAALQASGAILALPGAAAIGGAAIGTLSLATSGLGDVFDAVSKGDAKGIAAALQNIAPAARPAVQEMINFQNGLKGVQQIVQAKFFEGLAEPIKQLGATYLPMLTTGLGNIATSFNGVIKGALATAETPFFKGAVNTILESTARVVSSLGPLVNGLMVAFAAVAQAAAPFVEEFVKFIAQQAQAAGAFLSSAEGAQFMKDALNGAKEGFQTLGTILGMLLPVFKLLFTVLTTLSAAFNSLPGPLQTVVGGFVLFGGILGVTLLKFAPLISTLITLGPQLLVAGTAILGFGAKIAAAGLEALLFTGRIIAMAASVIFQFGLMIGQAIIWAATMVAQFVVAAAQAVVWAATMAAQFVMVAARAVAWAAVMAAQWLIAMGPIGWIIIAVVALVALIIANWDTVKQATIDAWNAVSSFLTGLWNSIKAAASAVFNAIGSAISTAWNSVVSWTTNAWNSVKNFVTSAWSSMTSAVSSGVSSVIGFVASLPGKALSALSSLGSLLTGLGRDMVNGLWNGISAGWSWLTGQVSALAQRLLQAAKSALGIASPSKEFEDQVGEPSGQGIGTGLMNSAGGIMSSIRSLTGQMVKEAAKIPGELPPITASLGVGSSSMSVGKASSSLADSVRQGAYEGVLAAMREMGSGGNTINIGGGSNGSMMPSDSIAQRLRSLSDLGVI